MFIGTPVSAIIPVQSREDNAVIAFLRGLPALSLAVGLAGVGFAHEIPTEVTAHLMAKPVGDRLQLLVRVPLSSMRDVEFPALPSGYLDTEKLAPQLPDLATVWIAGFIEIYEAGARLPQPRIAATRISLPSDKSFASFDQALAHVSRRPPPVHENLVPDQVLFDVLLEYPIRSDRAAFSMRPGLEHLAARVRTVLRFHTPEGSVRAYQFLDDPGRVPLDPSWGQAAWRFVELGFFHILDGPDHLLFLLCLVIPFRRLRPLVLIVTAFTIAHSLTLIASAFDLAPGAIWFPPLIETLIAITVVYMALENIAGASGVHRRWMIACGFGLDPRLRFLIRAARDAAVCRLPPADITYLVQPRRRVGADLGAVASGPRVGRLVPLRHRREDRDDHPFRAHSTHRLALDDRTSGAARSIQLLI